MRRSTRLLARRLSTVTRVADLAEVIDSATFPARVDAAIASRPAPTDASNGVRTALTAAMATTHLHTQSRIASFEGGGYYTIGPCGEELLAAVGLALRPTDPMALHYRHLGALVARQLQRGLPLDAVLLDRARGYVTSAADPVTGGVHCSLGADPRSDFLVTSTLASQGPQAVGRAVAIENLRSDRWPSDAISFVSCGDGSVNNSEWLSAVNAAEYVAHRGAREGHGACPTLFCVSDNGLCISLKGRGWVDKWAKQRLGMPTYRVDGTDLPQLMRTAAAAVEHVRGTRAPALLLLSGMPRRFGHAATDRQDAYLREAQIEAARADDPVARAAAAAIAGGALSRAELLDEYAEIGAMAERAFAEARLESRELSRAGLVARVAPAAATPQPPAPAAPAAPAGRAPTRVEMRKAMTAALGEELSADPSIVYLGEDVEHGGYYRVTDGLAARFGRRRVFDWPPDEASLVGCAVGLAQGGFTPLVEMPYAAYLSCGYNQFVEACFFHWLSNGRQPNGMVFRMQGFDEGVFGGHFHTANAPPVFGIPGLDVLAYSNGRDWARGLRASLRRAREGGVSMLLDSTALLNRRHVDAAARDGDWMFAPATADEPLGYDDVVLYAHGAPVSAAATLRSGEPMPLAPTGAGTRELALVTYGNGVPKALAARGASGVACDVIDCPLLSRPPAGLVACLLAGGYRAALLVDVCREGAGPLAQFVPTLRRERALPGEWELLTAAPTYNPLGRTATFVNEAEIADALTAMAQGDPVATPEWRQPVATAGVAASAASLHVSGSSRPRALVICPGRGSYNATELGSLRRLTSPELAAGTLAEADARMAAAGLSTLSELDARKGFVRKVHLESAHASSLIFSLAALDYQQRLAEQAAEPAGWEPAGFVGNSLGWYTSAHLSGALGFGEALEVVLKTGCYQREVGELGGQLVYPTMNDEWESDAALEHAVASALDAANASGFGALSVELGGAAVLAADDAGLGAMAAALPKLARGRVSYPLALKGHSAFHTHLMAPMAERLQGTPPFASPALPLVDGAGRVWAAGCDPSPMRQYTISEQVTTPYRFGLSLEVALAELQPDVLVLLGPGRSLGGAIGQTLARVGWHGVRSKADFARAQASERPLLLTTRE